MPYHFGISDAMILHLLVGYTGPRFFTGMEYREDTPAFLMRTVTLSASRSEFIYKFGVKIQYAGLYVSQFECADAFSINGDGAEFCIARVRID